MACKRVGINPLAYRYRVRPAHRSVWFSGYSLNSMSLDGMTSTAISQIKNRTSGGSFENLVKPHFHMVGSVGVFVILLSGCFCFCVVYFVFTPFVLASFVFTLFVLMKKDSDGYDFN